jgi:hypothetical protein
MEQQNVFQGLVEQILQSNNQLLHELTTSREAQGVQLHQQFQQQQQQFQQQQQQFQQFTARDAAPRDAPAGTGGSMSLAKAVASPDKFQNAEGQDVHRWVDSMDTYLRAINANDESTRVHVAATYLKGPPHDWFRMQPSGAAIRSEWSSFQAALVAEFDTLSTDQMIRDKLDGLCMGKSEDVQSHVDAFNTLAYQLREPLSEPDKLNKFTRGLNDEVRKLTLLASPTSFHAALLQARNVERVNVLDRRARTGSNRARGAPAVPSAPTTGTTPMDLTAVVAAVMDVRRHQGRGRGRGRGRGGQ